MAANSFAPPAQSSSPSPNLAQLVRRLTLGRSCEPVVLDAAADQRSPNPVVRSSSSTSLTSEKQQPSAAVQPENDVPSPSPRRMSSLAFLGSRSSSSAGALPSQTTAMSSVTASGALARPSPIAGSTAHQSHSMADLIPIVNRLQDVFSSTIGQDSLDLPQIVVIGSQSSGKSSVLENIVRKDFLPRGKDIVTRRPLVLQLVNQAQTSALAESTDAASLASAAATVNARRPPQTTDKDALPAEYAEFLHLPGRIFTDFAEVRAEVERETERMAGQNKGISRSPIHLRIYSPHVLTLTLVDLPGITKIPVGDQPPDIEVRIRKLVMEYISKPNAIILAVSPANQDIVNSEALKLAKEVDPEGRRTLGLLTKLDLMDAGTNAADVLSGRHLPLKLGFIGVVNRSQQDIMENKDIGSALKCEDEFFKTHPAYRHIASRCGTSNLAKTLNSLLMQHIRERLPEIKSRLNLLIVQTEQELASYGDPAFTGKAHQGSLVLRLLTRFSNNFNASIDGTYVGVSTQELCGGARLYYIFNSIFGQSLDNIDPCENLSAQDIRTAIRNSKGPRPSLFIPEVAFDLLVKPQIKRLEVPCMRCVELVFDEMLKIVNGCETKELIRFPRLHQKVVEVVVEMLRERMAPAHAYLESLISIQLAYINTNHPDFIGGSAAIAMHERKHEKRRRDLDKHRKQQQAMQQQVQNMSLNGSGANGNVAGNGRDSTKAAVFADDVTSAEPQSSKTHPLGMASLAAKSGESGPISALHQSLPHGRDGGFLTYFFGGNPVSISPELRTSSRAPSPTRRDGSPAANELYDMMSSRSDDTATFVNHQQSIASEREEIEVELIRSLIQSYFRITRKTIADLIPKTVMHLIVNHARENIQNRLVSTLYREDLFAELLMEDPEVMSERTKCKALLDTYKRGAAVLQDIY